MRQLLRRLAVTALLAPAAVGAASMIATPAQATPAQPAAQAIQDEVNRLTNLERGKHGCPALKVNAQLTAAALGHSEWMARTGTLGHVGENGSTFVTRARATGYGQPSGENVAYGYADARAVVDGWMNSPGHRANIVDCRSRSVGVGVAFTTGGTPYYTQNFGL